MSGNRRGFRSFNRDYGAEAGAVRMAAVRRKEVVLLGADADVIDGLDAEPFELGAVGCRKVEQEAISLAFAHEPRIELRRHFLADLVAAAADAWTNAGLYPPR